MMHHAILFRTSEPALFSVKNQPSETVVDQMFEKLTIDDVRQLIESAHRRPSEGSESTCFIVRTSFITSEAQHALLKLLEEPPSTSRFVFVTTNALELLPTVLSRFHVEGGEDSNDLTAAFKDFSKMGLKDRLETIEQKLKSKDLSWQESIRGGLITFLRTLSKSDKATLIDLEFVAANLLTRGASNKMLLDQLALSLPLK